MARADAALFAAIQAAPVSKRSELLRRAAQNAPAGAALEFGVFTGDSLRLIRGARKPPVIGFDCWAGLPERWVRGENSSIAPGVFATEPPRDLALGTALVSGLFEESLPAWLSGKGATHQIGFVHIDSDLYASAKTVLAHTVPRLQPGAVLVFDELCAFEDSDYTAWRSGGEWLALIECIADTGARFTPLGRSRHEQVALRFEGCAA